MNDVKINTLNSFTKVKLLNIINREKGNVKGISMRKKKQELIDYIIKENIRFVYFSDKNDIKEIPSLSKEEREERLRLLKNISNYKEYNRTLKRIYYKPIPTLEEYISIKKWNKNENNLKKKKPLRFIKINNDKDEMDVLYEQNKYKGHKIKYKIETNEDDPGVYLLTIKNITWKIKDKENKRKDYLEKIFFYDPDDIDDKYKTEYDLKIFIIEYLRKTVNKK